MAVMGGGGGGGSKVMVAFESPSGFVSNLVE